MRIKSNVRYCLLVTFLDACNAYGITTANNLSYLGNMTTGVYTAINESFL